MCNKKSISKTTSTRLSIFLAVVLAQEHKSLPANNFSDQDVVLTSYSRFTCEDVEDGHHARKPADPYDCDTDGDPLVLLLLLLSLRRRSGNQPHSLGGPEGTDWRPR